MDLRCADRLTLTCAGIWSTLAPICNLLAYMGNILSTENSYRLAWICLISSDRRGVDLHGPWSGYPPTPLAIQNWHSISVGSLIVPHLVIRTEFVQAKNWPVFFVRQRSSWKTDFGWTLTGNNLAYFLSVFTAICGTIRDRRGINSAFFLIYFT